MKEGIILIMKQIVRLIDVKSIVTLLLIAALVWIVLTERAIDEKVFLLFSNVVTMIVTYFFTKPKKGENA